MPTRRQSNIQPQPDPKLIMAREHAEQRLSERIQQGEGLLSEFQGTDITTYEQYRDLREKYNVWNGYNGEMIRRQLFDAPKYADDYLHVFGIFGGGSSLREDMRDLIDDTKRQLERLRVLRGKLEVIPLVDTVSTTATKQSSGRVTIFIGHGRDPQWRDLEGYIRSFNRFEVINYESAPRAGFAAVEVLKEMMEKASMGFIVHTAEDEAADGDIVRARENVIHEAGLFQGKLGFTRAIILLEEGCHEYSNIHGLGQIRFPKGNIKSAFGDVIATIVREFPYALSG